MAGIVPGMPPVPGARLIVPREAVDSALDRMAAELQPLLLREPCVLLGVLLGGMVPLVQLAARLHGNFGLDVCRVSRYGAALRGGVPEWLASPRTELQSRHIVVVDDIFDAGVTRPFVAARCRESGASQVTTVALVRKCHDRPREGPLPDHVGLEVGDEYVFGRGMDYQGQWRHLPDIWGLPDRA